MTASLSACPVLVLPTKRGPRARPFEEERTDPKALRLPWCYPWVVRGNLYAIFTRWTHSMKLNNIFIVKAKNYITCIKEFAMLKCIHISFELGKKNEPRKRIRVLSQFSLLWRPQPRKQGLTAPTSTRSSIREKTIRKGGGTMTRYSQP